MLPSPLNRVNQFSTITAWHSWVVYFIICQEQFDFNLPIKEKVFADSFEIIVVNGSGNVAYCQYKSISRTKIKIQVVACYHIVYINLCSTYRTFFLCFYILKDCQKKHHRPKKFQLHFLFFSRAAAKNIDAADTNMEVQHCSHIYTGHIHSRQYFSLMN